MSKIATLPVGVPTPMKHLEFQRIDVEIFSEGENLDCINKIGGVFLSGFQKRDTSTIKGVIGITPNHGRVAATAGPHNTAILIKGVGWTIGGPNVLLSNKDDELCFGLFDKKSAIREFSVSKILTDIGMSVTQVLGHASIKDERLTKARYRTGEFISPTLLYTKTRSLFRVNDLIYFSEIQRKKIALSVASVVEIEPKHYFDWFCKQLGESIGTLHAAGGCNDSLDWGNVTLAAEITDFEWIYIPGVPLPWGDGTEGLPERQEKEIIYAYEICIRLFFLLKPKEMPPTLIIIRLLEEGYSKSNRNHKNKIFSNLKSKFVLSD